jgi:hypothetical protein
VPLVPGANTIVVTATDAEGNSQADSIDVTLNTAPPTLVVNLPPPTVSSSPLSLSGTAVDDQGVVSVTWANAATGADGGASGTASWTADIPLAPGPNTLTIYAWDLAGNVTLDVVTVTYVPVDTTPPVLTVLTPASPTASTIAMPFLVDGVASDDDAVASVEWKNETTGVSGLASGTTSWGAPVPLRAGQNVVTIRATDASGNATAAAIAVTYFSPPDATPPALTIASPIPPAATAFGSPLLVVGTASDATGVTKVSWTNAATGGDGVASGTAAWTAPVPLAPGDNLLTFTAIDPAGNSSTATLLVTFNPPASDTIAPFVVITFPTSSASTSTIATTAALGGSAADDQALVAVVWANAATGQSGTASGDSTWTAAVALAPGDNLITVTAYDAAGHASSDAITVTAAGSGIVRKRGGYCGSCGLDLLWIAGALRLLRRRPGARLSRGSA